MDKPIVSAIITTKNSGSTMTELLKSLKAQSFKKIEIIVVDNSSSDDTCLIAKEFTKKVFQKGPERSTQRNFGAKVAEGKYLLFLDSDMVLTKDVIKECVDKIQLKKNKGELSIGGIIIPEKSFGRGFWAKTKILEREINKGETFFESARFFPKEIFRKFRGYDQNLTGPEDWDLPQRIAREFKIVRIKSLIRHNEGNLTLNTLFKKKMYYGLSAHKYLKKQRISIFSPNTIYFLRPAFYKNWRMLLKDPKVTLGMFMMLLVELVGGGLGYLKGRFRE